MAPQQQVAIASVLDTTEHDHITVTSTSATSMVSGNIVEKDNCMLRAFLCVRDVCIDKSSAKRPKYLNKFKRFTHHSVLNTYSHNSFISEKLAQNSPLMVMIDSRVFCT